MSIAPAVYDTTDPIIERLEDQITYYNGKSSRAQKQYKRIKSVEIIAAAMIPFLAALHVADTHQYIRIALALSTAGLGVLITILEGILQLQQYQQTWVTYRATCEALKHEKFTYIAQAGVYAKADDRHALLAERIETIGSQENTKWTSLQQPQKETKAGGN